MVFGKFLLNGIQISHNDKYSLRSMIDKIIPFWILVHLEVIKLCSKSGGELASMMCENARGK